MIFNHLCLMCGIKFEDFFPERLFCSQKCEDEYNKHEEYCPICMSESDDI